MERIAFNRISREELERLYHTKQLSLELIAREIGCTRQNVLRLMEKYGVERRTKSRARRVAQKREIWFVRTDARGTERQITLQDGEIRDPFYRVWSPEMAWALGVIYSACLDPVPRALSVSQKEPELLEKILAAMGSHARISYRPRRGRAGAVYNFSICLGEAWDDLIALGLSPAKSRTIQFPSMPPFYLRHFIRGCWDGSISIYADSRTWVASYVSGSRAFVVGMERRLSTLGFPRRPIHKHRRAIAYYFHYYGAGCAQLYHFLYDGVPESLYLKRKYDRFATAAASCEPGFRIIRPGDPPDPLSCDHPPNERRREFGKGRWYCRACNRAKARGHRSRLMPSSLP